MAVTFNHTIVHSKDRQKSATFLARIMREALPVAQIGSQERLAVSLYGAVLGSNRFDEGAESARP